MKALKLTPILLSMLFLFTFCQKDEMDMTQRDSATSGEISLKAGHDECEVVQILWAGAGQNDTSKGTNVGTLTATVVGDELHVTYSVNGTLTSVHLWVGNDLADVPRNAAPGRFPYKSGTISTSEYTFIVNLTELGIEPGETIYVAAHGDIKDFMMGTPVDLDNYLPETATVFVKYYGHHGFTGSYFKVDVSNGGVLNGMNYPGWCLDVEVPMNFNPPYNPYNAQVKLAKDHMSAYKAAKLNHLLNLDLSGYSLQTIQVAIWALVTGMDEAYFNANAVRLDVTGFNWGQVHYILGMLNEYFVPVCGGYFGVVLVKEGQQDIIIKVPVPCEYMGGDETIWAFGEHTFQELGVAQKWGWVFEIDCYEDDND